MVSNINPANPIAVSPTTASVRANFQTAHDEIGALQTSVAALAPLASPVFTGDPRAPTPPPGDNDQSIPTTSWVQSTIAPVASNATAGFNNVGRNYVHNGQFNVAQRGTGPFTTAFAYSLDRWVINANLDTFNVIQNTLSDTARAQIGDEAAVLNLTNTFTGNAGAGAVTSIAQYIENVHRLAGKTVTVSFYAGATGSLKLGCSLDQNFGTGGSPSAAVLGNGQSVTLSTTWTRHSMTFTLLSASGKTLGTDGNDSTAINFWFSAGTSYATRAGNIGVQSGTISIWGVQLEVGTAATPLEHIDPCLDQAYCQRFYQQGTLVTYGYQLAGQIIVVSIPLKPPMRTLPAVVAGAAAVNNNLTGGTMAPLDVNTMQYYATATTSSSYQYQNNWSASADL